jgi:Glycosyltransferase 61
VGQVPCTRFINQRVHVISVPFRAQTMLADWVPAMFSEYASMQAKGLLPDMHTHIYIPAFASEVPTFLDHLAFFSDFCWRRLPDVTAPACFCAPLRSSPSPDAALQAERTRTEGLVGARGDRPGTLETATAAVDPVFVDGLGFATNREPGGLGMEDESVSGPLGTVGLRDGRMGDRTEPLLGLESASSSGLPGGQHRLRGTGDVLADSTGPQGGTQSLAAPDGVAAGLLSSVGTGTIETTLWKQGLVSDPGEAQEGRAIASGNGRGVAKLDRDPTVSEDAGGLPQSSTGRYSGLTTAEPQVGVLAQSSGSVRHGDVEVHQDLEGLPNGERVPNSEQALGREREGVWARLQEASSFLVEPTQLFQGAASAVQRLEVPDGSLVGDHRVQPGREDQIPPDHILRGAHAERHPFPGRLRPEDMPSQTLPQDTAEGQFLKSLGDRRRLQEGTEGLLKLPQRSQRHEGGSGQSPGVRRGLQGHGTAGGFRPAPDLRTQALQVLGLLPEQAPARPRLALVSRMAKRLLLNARELADAARQIGVETSVLPLEALTLYEQIAALQGSTVLAAMHGAALCTAVWLPENATMIQVRFPVYCCLAP